MIEKTRRDVVVKCSHGARGGHADFAERFRWMSSQAVWAPTVSGITQMTSLRGDEVDDVFDPRLSGPIRHHYAVKCQKCPNSVSIREEVLQQICVMLTGWSDYAGPPNQYRQTFAMLATHNDDASVTITLDGLRASLQLHNDMLDQH